MCMSARNKALAGTALVALIGGCTVGPDFVRPDPPAAGHYTGGTDPGVTVAAAGVAQHFTAGTAAGDWWRLFKSPGLDRIVAEALAGNPGLEAAKASLRQSEATLRSGYGIFYPQIGGDFSPERQKYLPARVGADAPGGIFSLFTLSASVSYTLDIFGGERRMVEGLAAQVDLQRADAAATGIALSANIVNTLVADAAYRAEIEATAEIIRLEREQVRLAEIEAGAGTVPYATVLGLKTQLALTEAAIPALQQKRSQAEDLLATLAGRTPAEWQAPPLAFAELTLPDNLPVSLPSDLVRQRPDILAAEATLHEASAQIGVATAALLPTITLDGGYGTGSTAAAQLFGAASRFWSFGADVTQPIFEGGTLWEKRKAAIEGFNQAKTEYRQTVLAAFAQVADTLRGLEHDAEILEAEDEAQTTADETLKLTQANYAAGIATYLDLLNADAQDRQARIAELQARAQRYQDTVALFTALGGGWQETVDVAKAGS